MIRNEVEDDAVNVFSKGVIIEEGKKTLTKLHKALRVNKLPQYLSISKRLVIQNSIPDC